MNDQYQTRLDNTPTRRRDGYFLGLLLATALLSLSNGVVYNFAFPAMKLLKGENVSFFGDIDRMVMYWNWLPGRTLIVLNLLAAILFLAKLYVFDRPKT